MTEPHACGACFGPMRRLWQVPVLQSLEGRDIFECLDCGELTVTAQDGAPGAHWLENVADRPEQFSVRNVLLTVNTRLLSR
jgi:hypothetical protein